ncbi:hypothetical protein [Maritimibacter alexandrii]|uniref:hypothetical protein n=1 Tax=Maritimibacter alexandrii TaxID=2570355 RepID=UPI0011097491|nr:hypothetical protein [Maritimibacter alexandrii]
MTEYVMRATFVCPEALMADANQLALVVGESPADVHTFAQARFEDAGGNRYAVASSLVKAGFLQAASSALEAPAHSPGVDLEAAGRAQAAVTIFDPNAPLAADPARLLTIVSDDPKGALALAGVTRI